MLQNDLFARTIPNTIHPNPLHPDLHPATAPISPRGSVRRAQGGYRPRFKSSSSANTTALLAALGHEYVPVAEDTPQLHLYPASTTNMMASKDLNILFDAWFCCDVDCDAC